MNGLYWFSHIPTLTTHNFSEQQLVKFVWNYIKIIELRHDKTNKMSVHPAKTQINLGIRPVWSESLLCAQRVAKYPSFLHADSENSDQTGRIPRLIWVFARRTLILLVLSCRGSYVMFLRTAVCLRVSGIFFFLNMAWWMVCGKLYKTNVVHRNDDG